MKCKQTPIASAVALMLMSAAFAVHAQQAPAPAPQPDARTADQKAASQLGTVTITGIRDSLAKSIEVKRNSDAVVEVITAEDIGKMPDKNVADSLQRVPGVTISSASASEGGFDENDRVSLRGTSPSLTQTLINGHSVATGDWFVLNQVGTVGRSVSYSLLPSEVVSAVVVRKGYTPDLVEGGVAGSVDIITRKPLEFRKQLTMEAAIGGVYSDLPGKTEPQANALINWKNDNGNLGLMGQIFYEKRSLRRDGQETLGYSTIAPGSAIATAHPDLAGVKYPNAIGSVLFEQTRERKGGMFDAQLKATNDLSFDLSTFFSKLEATNFNRNFIVWPSHIINGGAGQSPDPGYVVRNNTLVAASFANLGTGGPDDSVNRRQYAIDDQIYRPGAHSETWFVNLDGQWNVNDRLKFLGKVGTTKGTGETPEQDVFEGDIFNTGATYQLNGTGRPADASLPNGNPSSFAGVRLDWVFGASPAKSEDKENWGQIDGEYALDTGVFNALKFGARLSSHDRSTTQTAQGPGPGAFDVANLPAWSGQTYPGDFGQGLNGNFPKQPWQLDPAVLQAWGALYSNRNPITRQYWPGEFKVKEDVSAGYVMGTMEGKGWGGNVGARLVQTRENVKVNVAIPGAVCAVQAPCGVPGAITTSAFGSFYQTDVKNTYNDVLPAANLWFDVTKDVKTRLAATRTMARPDYSALGGAVSLDDLNHTGNGGNPNLKPIYSNNYEAAAEWYFAPRSIAQANLFYMDLTNYVSFGTAPLSFLNVQSGRFETYNVSSPQNSTGKVKGAEVALNAPIWGGFGVITNYTYADGQETGGKALVGTSRHTYNLVGYYENDRFNARLAYNYRSAFFNGLDRSTAQYQDDTASLAASIGYRINDTFSVSLDGQNLNDPLLKYYADNKDQPTAFYKNGRQYFLMLRAKM